MPAAAMDLPPVRSPRLFTKKNKPSRPYTIAGTPARLRMFSSMNRVNRFLGAYSSNQMAAPMPMGKASTATNTAIQNVPTKAWCTPSLGSSESERMVPDKKPPGRPVSSPQESITTSTMSTARMNNEISRVTSKLIWKTRPRTSVERRSIACTIILLVRSPMSLALAISTALALGGRSGRPPGSKRRSPRTAPGPRRTDSGR